MSLSYDDFLIFFFGIKAKISNKLYFKKKKQYGPNYKYFYINNSLMICMHFVICNMF